MQRWRWYLLVPVLALCVALAWGFWPRDGAMPYESVNSGPVGRAPAADAAVRDAPAADAAVRDAPAADAAVIDAPLR